MLVRQIIGFVCKSVFVNETVLFLFSLKRIHFYDIISNDLR